jgi:hypothetical protein
VISHWPDALSSCSHCSPRHRPSRRYPQQSWQLPRGCSDRGPAPGEACTLQRFSAICWYFGLSLNNISNTAAATTAAAAVVGGSSQSLAGEPVPIGLIHSSIGGTTIQQWMPPWTTNNGTCADNNCGYSVAMNTSKPQCTNESQSNVWSCPSGHCSDLWHGMIAPLVNTTIAGAVWYVVLSSSPLLTNAHCCHHHHHHPNHDADDFHHHHHHHHHRHCHHPFACTDQSRVAKFAAVAQRNMWLLRL